MTSPHQPQDQRDHGADQHSDRDAASGSVEAHGSPVIAARWPFNIGDRVRSKAIGRCAAFEGDVIRRFLNGCGNPHFHVRYDRGKLWHRDVEDLTCVPLPAPPGDA